MAPARFLILSDTHDKWPYTDEMPAPGHIDVLLHCGDMTQVGGLPSFKRAIESIKSIDAELKLVIAGNHDLELDEKWVQDNAKDADELEGSRQCIEFLCSLKQFGIYYLEEGSHSFTLSSGRNFSVYASPYTPKFNGYAFAYGSEDRFNHGSKPMPNGVNIAMTYGPPLLVEDCSYRLDINGKGEHLGCKKLAKAIQRVKPKMHCFGHIHEGRGLARAIWKDGESAPPTIAIPKDEHPSRIQKDTASG